MTRLMNMKKAKLMAAGLAICFLVIHVFMFWLFTRYGVVPMARFNIFSMAFYVGILLAVWQGWLQFYAVSVYLEVVLHMSLAAVFTGWEGGFQNTLFGMSMLMAYAEYVARYLKIRYIPSAPMCLVGMLAYIAACVYTYHHPAAYPLPGHVAFTMQIFWGVVVFSITIFFLSVFVLLSSRAEEALSREVQHDQLTGLPNRYYITEYLEQLAINPGLENHWIAMVDIDDFKNINDTYGHNCGDFVLRELAVILRESEIKMKACRWGGEEFILTGRIEDGMVQCARKLNALRETVRTHCFEYEELKLYLTITLGAAEYRPGYTVKEWIEAADRRMYLGKTHGKNQVVA